MEKFFDIVCRVGGLPPSAIVLVATVKALKHHGGNPEGGAEAIEAGAANLARHLGIIREFGLNAVVAVNRFPADTTRRSSSCGGSRSRPAPTRRRSTTASARRRRRDGAGRGVVAAADEPTRFDYLYPLDATIEQKIEAIAKRVYGADGIFLQTTARDKIARFDADGLDGLPICMAKTHLSLSHDPTLTNAPTGFTVTVRDIRAYTGAGWLVALCGDMQTMPGWARRRPRSTSTSTTRAGPSACSEPRSW